MISRLPPGFPLTAMDADGNALAPGDLVLIPPIPDWLVRDLPEDDVEVLRTLEGRSLRILRFDDHGYAWFGDGDDPIGWFCLRPDELRWVRTEREG